MTITPYSFFTSLLFFNIFVVLVNLLKKNNKFILKFNVFSILFIVFLSIVRIVFVFSPNNIKIIHSTFILNNLANFLTYSPIKYMDIKISEIGVLIWLFVSVFLFIKSILSYVNLKQYIITLDIVENEKNLLILDEIKKEMNYKGKIELIQSNGINSPMVMGYRKGTIFIPNIDFSHRELSYILIHEINHLKNKDFLKKIFMQFLVVCFWWNPFIHKLANDFNHILEVKCDLNTTSRMKDDSKMEYLETILKVLEFSKARSMKYEDTLIVPCLIKTNGIEQIKQRFELVLEEYSASIYQYILYIPVIMIFILSYYVVFLPEFFPEEEDFFRQEEEVILIDFWEEIE